MVEVSAMRKIHITRNRQSIGQYTPEEVSDGLRSGKFLPTDLAWQEPMPTWKPLSEFSELPDATEIAPEPDEITPPPIAPALPEPAWERRDTMGIFPSIVATVQQVLSSPTPTFRSMKTNGGLEGPLLYYVSVGTLCSWVAMTYQFIGTLMSQTEMKELADKGVSQMMFGIIFLGIMILVPAILLVGSFISAGIFHVSLMIAGAENKSYQTTFRVLCYACGSAATFNLIPLCGNYIYAIWAMVAMAIGFREAHGISTSRAVVAVILPTLLCCGIFFVVIVAFGFIAGVAASGAFK